MKSFLNWDVFSTHLKPPTNNFYDISHPYKLFSSQYLRYKDSQCLSGSFMHLFLAFTYPWTAWHIPLDIFFTINCTIISVKRCNFSLAFFKTTYHANPGTVRKQAGLFQGTYFESSQIHQLTIMYRFEQRNHYILLHFYFKIFTNSSRVQVICMSNILHVLVTPKSSFSSN